MGHAGGKLPDRLQFLRVAQLVHQCQTFGDVLKNKEQAGFPVDINGLHAEQDLAFRTGLRTELALDRTDRCLLIHRLSDSFQHGTPCKDTKFREGAVDELAAIELEMPLKAVVDIQQQTFAPRRDRDRHRTGLEGGGETTLTHGNTPA